MYSKKLPSNVDIDSSFSLRHSTPQVSVDFPLYLLLQISSISDLNLLQTYCGPAKRLGPIWPHEEANDATQIHL